VRNLAPGLARARGGSARLLMVGAGDTIWPILSLTDPEFDLRPGCPRAEAASLRLIFLNHRTRAYRAANHQVHGTGRDVGGAICGAIDGLQLTAP